jgi:hypothetical protein
MNTRSISRPDLHDQQEIVVAEVPVDAAFDPVQLNEMIPGYEATGQVRQEPEQFTPRPVIQPRQPFVRNGPHLWARSENAQGREGSSFNVMSHGR